MSNYLTEFSCSEKRAESEVVSSRSRSAVLVGWAAATLVRLGYVPLGRFLHVERYLARWQGYAQI